MFRNTARTLSCLCLAAACSAPALAEEQVEFAMAFVPGDSHRNVMVIDMGIDQVVMGNAMQIKQLMEFGMRYDVLDRPADAGGAWVKMTYEHVKFSMAGPFGQMQYDSTDEAANPQGPSAAFASLVGQSIDIEYDAGGNVVKIDGYEAVAQNMIDAMNLPEGQGREMMAGMVKSQFNEETIKQWAGSTAGAYPGKPVARGDSWKHEQKVAGMMPMAIGTTYTLKDFDDQTVTLTIDGKIGPNPDAGVAEMGGAQIDAEMNGTQSGELVLERDTGWLSSSRAGMDMEGGMTVSQPNGQPVDVEMKISGEVTISSPDASPNL